jgi:hypothetical protein
LQRNANGHAFDAENGRSAVATGVRSTRNDRFRQGD